MGKSTTNGGLVRWEQHRTEWRDFPACQCLITGALQYPSVL